MALSAAQIANAVAYYSGQNARISNLIQNSSANVAAVAAGGRVSAKGTPLAPAPKPAAQQKKVAAPKLDNIQQMQVATGALSKKDALAAAAGKASNPLLNFQTWLNQHANPAYPLLNDVVAPQGKDQAPTNAAQWFMNLLSTPVYATSRFAEGLGKAANDWWIGDNGGGTLDADTGKVVPTPQTPQQKHATELANNDIFGYLAGSIGEGFAQSFGGLARGVAEGVGARFDNERPRTWGQNFEDIGLTKSVEDAAGDLGATDSGSHFFDNKQTYGGLLGFAGDVALDPTTYIGGTGLLKGVKGALEGTADATRAGAKLSDAVKAGGKGFVQGVGDAAAERAAAAASKAQRAALLNGNVDKFVKAGGDPTLFRQASDATENVARDLAGKAPVEDVLPIPKSVAETPKGPSLTDRKAAVDALLPHITGTVTRDVPAEQILRASARPGERAMAPELGDAIRAAAAEPTKVSEIRSGISQIAATPEGRKALAATIRVGREDVSVKDAITSVATRRLTGGQSGAYSARADAVGRALEQHLAQQTARPAVWDDPGTLRDAVRSLLPDASRNIDELNATGSGLSSPQPYTQLGSLVGRIQRATSMTERKQIITNALGTTQKRYQTFDQALLGATSGEIGDVAVMRQMLKALGIDTTMTDPNAVRAALDGEGRAAWSDIQAAVRNQDEVLSDHGISATEARAAQLADEIQQARDAKAANDAIARELGYDPTKVTPPRYNGDTPAGGAAIGNAIHHGVAAVGDRLLGKQLSETYGRDVLKTLHQALVRTFRLRLAGKTGAARGENVFDDYLAATIASENYYRSLGNVPHLPAGAGRTPLYVSFGQVLAHLPREVAIDALFRPYAYRLGAEAGDAAYKAGLSIYPTTIAEGARAAVQATKDARGDVAAVVRSAMEKDGAKNAYQATAMGQERIDALAQAMTAPEFRGALAAMHDQQLIVATRIAQKTSEGLVMPVAARIATVLGSGGERGELTAAIREGYADIEKATRDLDGAPTLAHDLATQRLDNALVNGVLGQWGHALAAMDGRAAAAARQAGKVGPQATREATTQSMVRLADDSEELVDDAIDQRVLSGELEDTEVERATTYGEMHAELEAQGVFGKLLSVGGHLGTAAEGSFGQGALFPLRVEAEQAAKDSVATMYKQLKTWRDGRGTGVRARLGEALQLGRIATNAEVDAAMTTWWRGLATLGRQFPDLPDGSIREGLIRGIPMNARAGVRDAVPGLDEAQADMAMELLTHIRQVFQKEAGPLHRLGVTGADVNQYLLRFGQGDHLLDDTASAIELADHWKSIETDAPLNTLMMYRSALDHAGVRPMLAAGLTRLFGNPADWKMTAAEARAAGWRATEQSGSLRRYIPKGTLLEPEIRRNMVFVEHALDELDKNLPKFFSTVFLPIDAITSFIKPSMTIWRTGHHVSNMLGNALFALMHGYNPMSYVRTMGTMRLLGQLSDVDETALSRFDQTWMQNVADQVPGFTGALKPKMTRQSATVALKDGTVLDIPPEKLAAMAQRSGIVMTAHQAKDLAPEREIDSFGGARDRFVNAKWNVVAKANRKIASATTIYENVSRLAVMMQAIESRTWRSLDEAMTYAAGEVAKVHPSRETLSVFDRKYTTRIILFHNWMRGAIGSVLRTAVERPKLVTIPSTWQYEQAEAQGLEPESIGKPFNNDPRIASYYTQGLLGPTWLNGLSPFGGIDDLQDGEAPHQYGASLSAPQLDALTAYFGGLNFGEDPLTNLRVMAGSVNPVVAAPIELAGNTELGSETGQQIVDPQKGDWGPQYANWLWQQTGFPASVTSAFGLTNTHATWTDAENQGDKARKLFNFLAGLKVVDYTNPTSAKIGTSQQGEEITQELRNIGYSDAQVKEIQRYYKTTLP